MTIRRLRASITRLVLVTAMALAVAAGGVAVGPRHEAAAKPRECEMERILASITWSLFVYYNQKGDKAQADYWIDSYKGRHLDYLECMYP